jgi:diguanylate cyclase (GGDEF)-like protein
VLTIEKGITTSTAVTNGSIVVADDILGKIVASGKPEILNDIPSAREAEAVRYYSRTQSIKSIVGVPVFYNDRLRGIVLIDSKESDIFGIETIYSLGRFVRLITILMQMFDERYSENISVQRLRALIEFLNPLSTVRKESEVIDIIENKIGELVQWDSFTLISYHAHMKEFFVEMAVKKPKLHYIDVETKIDLQGTIVGNCILSGKPQKINDISAVPMPRFTLSENIVFNGSFLCVPLIYQNKNYGVLCFESLRKSFYSVDDLNFLQSIGSILAFVMYSYTTQTLLRQISAYDLETNLFNEKIFQILMEHEFYRCKETSLPAVLVYIHIDETPEQATLFGGSPFMKMVAALAKILSDDAVPNSYCAKLGERKFGVYFFNASVADIHVWAERIRAKITKLNQHSFAKNSIFTVSMGITAFHERKSLDEVFQLAQHALDKAIELGGNKIIR